MDDKEEVSQPEKTWRTEIGSLWHPSIECIQPDDSSSSESSSDEENELDELLIRLWKGQLPTPIELKWLVESATEILRSEPNVLKIDAPVTIVGDIHGQFDDLVEVFRISGLPPFSKYLFLGDYVDRGAESVQVISLLLALKIKYPKVFWLIRGNHESMQMTQEYGFRQEILQKYRSEMVYLMFKDLFEAFPIASIIGSSIFCVHGGFSQGAMTIKEIEELNRFREIPPSGTLTDMLWADPCGDDDYFVKGKQRNAGVNYGGRATLEFLKRNNLSLIARAHEFMDKGSKYCHSMKVLTIFSAPNYCSSASNDGAILLVDENLGRSLVKFQSAPKRATVTELLSHFVY